MGTKQEQQSLRVSPDVWRRARVKALGEGRSMTAVVGQLLEAWLMGPPVAPLAKQPLELESTAEAERRRVMVRPAMGAQRSPQVAQGGAKAEPSSDVRCVTCGERWAFHQGGASKNLAVKTNCRAFREAE